MFRVWWQAGPGGLCRMWGEQQSTGHKERQAGKWSASAWASPSSHPGAYIITIKMLQSRKSHHPEPAHPPAQPWCLEDALCGFMSLASPTGSCLHRGIPWPSTPPPQSHEENVMYFPMCPATPVLRTGTAGEPNLHHSHTCAKNG